MDNIARGLGLPPGSCLYRSFYRATSRTIEAGLERSEQFVWWHGGSWLTNEAIYSFAPDRFVAAEGPLAERPEVALLLHATVPTCCEWRNATAVSKVGNDLRIPFDAGRTASLTFQLPDQFVQVPIGNTVMRTTEKVEGGPDNQDARRRQTTDRTAHSFSG